MGRNTRSKTNKEVNKKGNTESMKVGSINQVISFIAMSFKE